MRGFLTGGFCSNRNINTVNMACQSFIVNITLNFLYKFFAQTVNSIFIKFVENFTSFYYCWSV